jgi:vacuolar-type H+-ATPase subunit F/Vma7
VRAAIRALCRPEVAPGLALAGLTPIAVTDGPGAAAALGELGRAPAHGGVILIQRSLLDALPPAVHRQLAREGLPILVPFPDPALGGAGRAADEELVELLRRAVGYKVRLR